MRLSIITINRNNANGLKKSIESMSMQTFKDFEYIIIDGESNDGSIEIIESNAKIINFWISEKDTGIYNAMNKGLKYAKGDYVYFLNSGDIFASNNVLDNIFTNLIDTDFIFCSIISNFKNKRVVRSTPDRLSFFYLFRNGIIHQATFTKRSYLSSQNGYDEKLISADWKLLITSICLDNATYKVLDLIIGIYDTNGMSMSAKSKKTILEEKEVVMNNYFSAFKPDFDRLRTLNKFTPTGLKEIIRYKIEKIIL